MSKGLTRREMLRKTVLGSIGLSLSSPALLSAGQPPSERLNVAFVGVGGRGRANLLTIARDKQNVVALCDVDEERAGESFGMFPQAKKFHESVNVNAVIITKMDGTAKAGGAMSAVAETEAPIVFLGTGERLDELEPFDPTRFISRLLGMGDLQALMERVEEVVDEAKAE